MSLTKEQWNKLSEIGVDKVGEEVVLNFPDMFQMTTHESELLDELRGTISAYRERVEFIEKVLNILVVE